MKEFFYLYNYQFRKKSSYFFLEQKYISYINQSYIEKYQKNINITSKDLKKITNNNFVNEIYIFSKIEKLTEPPYIILDQLNDYGNIGDIVRTMVAFGFKNLIYIHDTQDLYHHKIYEASRGLLFKINFINLSVNEFYIWKENKNLEFIGTHPNYNLQNNISSNSCFIFGNESTGIHIKCDKYIGIPIRIESLNVSTSAGILLNYYQQN